MKYVFLFSALLLMGAGCTASTVVQEEIERVGEHPSIVQEDEESKAVTQTTDLGIVDYYLLLPEEGYFSFEEGRDRTLDIDVLDENNFYLSITPRVWDGAGSLAVFLHGDRELVVGERRGCGPACEQDVFVLEYIDGEWIDLTDQEWTAVETAVLTAVNDAHVPDPSPDAAPFVPLFEIPRFGTTINVYDQFTGDELAEVLWKGGEFVFEN